MAALLSHSGLDKEHTPCIDLYPASRNQVLIELTAKDEHRHRVFAHGISCLSSNPVHISAWNSFNLSHWVTYDGS